MRAHMSVWFVALLVIAIAAAGCGGRPSSATRTPIGPTPTPTEVPPTPTPTPVPLTLEERNYLDAVYRLRDRYDRDAMSWTLMEKSLKGLKAPDSLAVSHDQMVSSLSDANFAFEMFRLSAMTYLLSYCSYTSWDYSSCVLRQDNAKTDMERYGSQADSARARFRTLWAEAQKTWDDYRVARGEKPVPTATPFPMPPVKPPVPRDTAATGVFGSEVTVTAVDWDAWSAIEAENSSNKAPGVGNKYAMVTVRVINRSSEPIWVSASQFSIYADATAHQESNQTNPNDFEAKELGAGESVSGNLSFEVPMGVSDAILLYLNGDLVMALK